MSEGNGINNIILWVGNLCMAGALFFYASARGRGCFAQASSRQKGWGIDLFAVMDRLLEFAVYSAVMIQMMDLLVQEIAVSGEYGWMLYTVQVLSAQGMIVLFLVLRMLCGGRKSTENADSFTVLREEGESVLAMLLLLALAWKGFQTADPRKGYQAADPWKAFGLQLLLLEVLFLLLYLKKKRWERQPGEESGEFAMQQQRQVDYFKSVDVQYQRTRELWHDLKNHIGVLEILAREERFPELTDYLNSFKQDVEIRMIPMKTGNTAVDALLGDKLYRARKMEIEVSIQVSHLSEMMIPATDFCAVLGNLLDNAIEACRQFHGKGRIGVRLKRQENFYYLTVVNTAVEPEHNGNGFVSGKKGYDNGVGHGLGLRSVERIAHQYGGSLVTNYAEGEFKAVVRLQEKES